MIRPINDWILVRLLPMETQIGSILLPEGTDHRKAVVVSTGPGRDVGNGVREPTGVEPGEHVVFNRAHAEHQQGKMLVRELGGDMLLLKPRDILFVYEGEVTVS